MWSPDGRCSFLQMKGATGDVPIAPIITQTRSKCKKTAGYDILSLLALRRMVVLLVFVNRMMFAYMIGHQATARTNTGTDQRTTGASYLGADQGSANGRSADNLGLSVVMAIMALNLRLRVLVRLLCEHGERHCENCCGHCIAGKLENLHENLRDRVSLDRQ